MNTDRISDRPEFDLTLLANFVHQVVNPLNGVAGTLDNLADGTIGEDRQKQRATVARAQLEGCINLLRNLAFLVNRPQDPSGIERKTVVLPQVIIEAAMYFQEEAGDRGISIVLNDRRTQNRCSAHPDLIRQVLMNIFDNCAKYSMDNTGVLVKQWIQRRTGMAMITITNTPKYPISNLDLNRIFDLGFRGENAKRSVASGTGLGMYICKQIIEDLHGGALQAGRERDQLRFDIRIPGGHF